jgi:squalene cyclase
MTGMAGIALLAEGSTTTQGRFAPNIRAAVDFLVSISQRNGLIGEPFDDKYTYGHGYALLFLSQVLGEEEDLERREELIDVITRAVQFSGWSQTSSGGWGYMSARDINDVDEGSTAVTQIQALRAARNAGIPVPREIIDRAVAYLHKVAIDEGRGGIQYSLRIGGGGRPAITAASIVSLTDMGEYDDPLIPNLLIFVDRHLGDVNNPSQGFWHYAHYYFAQVNYRRGGEVWENYRNRLFARLIREQNSDGSWRGNFGSLYVTASNLTILQLDNGTLPIFMR